MESTLLITCEHGGNEVPREYRALFRDAQRALQSHRGYDPGALALARGIARRYDAPLAVSAVTRLLVELNRSPHHRRLFSEFTRGLDKAAKEAILRSYYEPHRGRVERWVAAAIAAGKVAWHVGVHTFTPVLDGEVRAADVGLLYDPRSPRERRWAAAWRRSLLNRRADLRVRCNYPYRGAADGLTTWLRRKHGRSYVGLELEVNQSFVRRGGAAWRELRNDIAATLGDSLRKAAG